MPVPPPPNLWTPDGENLVILGDNLDIAAQLPDESFRLIYLDPPFNTGRKQSRQSLTTTRAVGDAVAAAVC